MLNWNWTEKKKISCLCVLYLAGYSFLLFAEFYWMKFENWNSAWAVAVDAALEFNMQRRVINVTVSACVTYFLNSRAAGHTGIDILQIWVATGHWHVGFYRWHLLGAWRDACSGVQSGGDRPKPVLHSGSRHSDPLWGRAHQTGGEQNPAVSFSCWTFSVQSLFLGQSLRAVVFAVPLSTFCLLNVMVRNCGFRRWAAAEGSQRKVSIVLLICWKH